MSLRRKIRDELGAFVLWALFIGGLCAIGFVVLGIIFTEWVTRSVN